MQANAGLTVTGSGPLTVYPNNLSVQYGSNIQVPDAPAGGTVGIVQMGQLSFELPDSYDFFQSDGGSTMAFTGTVINGTSSIDCYDLSSKAALYLDGSWRGVGIFAGINAEFLRTRHRDHLRAPARTPAIPIPAAECSWPGMRTRSPPDRRRRTFTK